MKSSFRAIAFLTGAVAAAACGSDGTGPSAGSHVVAVYAGNAQFGTSAATLAEPLRVLVIDAMSETPQTGVQVSWRVIEGAGASLTAPTSTTNSQGVASMTLRLGTQLGSYGVEATAASGVGEPAVFTARAVAVPAITGITPASANAGSEVTINGQNFSATADENIVTFGGFRGRVTSATATQIRTVIPACVPSRNVGVQVALGAVAGNPSAISVSGTNSSVLQLAPGESSTFSDAAALSCFRLPGNISGLMFLVVPQNFSQVLNTLTGVELAALTPGAAAVTLTERPLVTSDAEDWEWRLRKRERALLAAPGAALRQQSSVSAAACPGTAQIGSRCEFQVLDKESKFERVTAEVKAISNRAIVYQDINAPAGNGLTTNDFAALGTVFDNPIYSTDVATFGTPSDLDSNGKVIILLTPVVNALTDRGSSGFIAGFFYGCDLLSRTSCAGSNGAEIFYALTADPSGQFSDARSRDAVMRSLPPVLAHEFQHMINFGRRGNGTIDALWLSEGMAHHAEDVVGDVFQSLGDVVNAELFKRQNNTRADRFLRATGSTSLIADEEVGSLELRGAAWLFVKYIAGQYGNEILQRLTRSTAEGVANVTAETAKTWQALLADWAVALWADDAPELAGVTLKREHTFPDVNLRQRISSNSTYPLRPTVYGFEDFIQRETLLASSQSYVLLQGGAAPQPLNLTFAGKYGGAFATNASPQVTILRVR